MDDGKGRERGECRRGSRGGRERHKEVMIGTAKESRCWKRRDVSGERERMGDVSGGKGNGRK